MRINIKPLEHHEGLPLPAYASDGASGMDIRACVDSPVTINPGEIRLIPTGLAVSIPAGYEAQIRARSGLALKHGIGMVNSPGTVDSDYRGEVGVILINWGKAPFVVRRGDRIAQMVISKVCRAEVVATQELAPTARGTGGFGHSGIA
ncbi:MAG: dUTP diphosphatase [Deltaproteobacteria bacterium]|nr:dUTP diphosphatase [Deltaproteobacteria bacterium]OQX65469.1 MAG: deoxyuridine 5'-triphosphate nucleotidohydrolase [Desulfococcus sp. 4484_242]